MNQALNHKIFDYEDYHLATRSELLRSYNRLAFAHNLQPSNGLILLYFSVLEELEPGALEGIKRVDDLCRKRGVESVRCSLRSLINPHEEKEKEYYQHGMFRGFTPINSKGRGYWSGSSRRW